MCLWGLASTVSQIHVYDGMKEAEGRIMLSMRVHVHTRAWSIASARAQAPCVGVHRRSARPGITRPGPGWIDAQHVADSMRGACSPGVCQRVWQHSRATTSSMRASALPRGKMPR